MKTIWNGLGVLCAIAAMVAAGQMCGQVTAACNDLADCHEDTCFLESSGGSSTCVWWLNAQAASDVRNALGTGNVDCSSGTNSWAIAATCDKDCPQWSLSAADGSCSNLTADSGTGPQCVCN